jgi:hypothetical protein
MHRQRTLWLVRTRFDFVELFVSYPQMDGRRWSGRCIYVFDPLTVWALGLRHWLRRDIPTRMVLQESPGRCPWRFVKVSAEELHIDRHLLRWVCIIRFCDRMIQAVGMADAPNGSIVFPTFVQ